MRKESIKVGAKSKSQRDQLTLSYHRPDNVADCAAICGLPKGVDFGSDAAKPYEAAIAALFNRGYTIWLQDRLGRPMFEEGKTAEAIQAAFDTAVPGKTKGVSRKVQKTVAIPKGQKSFTPEDIAKLLQAQGISIVSSQ